MSQQAVVEMPKRDIDVEQSPLLVVHDHIHKKEIIGTDREKEIDPRISSPYNPRSGILDDIVFKTPPCLHGSHYSSFRLLIHKEN
jgi:hypothetical protein